MKNGLQLSYAIAALLAAAPIQGGRAVNALPQLAAATVNCRVLPDDAKDYVQDERMRVQSIHEGHAFLYELLKRLSRSTTTS